MTTIFTNPQGGAWQNQGPSNIVPYQPKMPVVVPGAEPIDSTARVVGRGEQAVNALRNRMPSIGKSLRVGAVPGAVAAGFDVVNNLPALAAPDVGIGTKAKILGTTALKTIGSVAGGTAGAAAGSAVLPGVGTLAGGAAGGVAGNYAGDQAASGFRRLANQVNGALGGDPNYFTSVEDDLAKVGRDANGSKVANLPAAPQQVAASQGLRGRMPVGTRQAAPTTATSVPGVNRFKEASGSTLFTDAESPEAAAARNLPMGVTQSAEEQAKTAGINARADQINQEIHALKMAEVHGGNAEDYLPGGSRDGGDGQRAAERSYALRDALKSPDNRVRDRAVQLQGQEMQNNIALRNYNLEERRDGAMINWRNAEAQRANAMLPGQVYKQGIENQAALDKLQGKDPDTLAKMSSQATADQTLAAGNRKAYMETLKGQFGGDEQKASEFADRVDHSYKSLQDMLAKPEANKEVLAQLGLDPASAKALYASMHDSNGALMDIHAAGNVNNRKMVENAVKRAQYINKDSFLKKTSSRNNAFDPYYYDDDANEIARGGKFGQLWGDTADKLYPVAPRYYNKSPA